MDDGVWLSLARAPGLGPGGRRFESCHPDSYKYARVAQLVERDLAKVGAAGSNPVSRFDIEKISKKLLTNENSYDTISELLLKKLATTNLDN